MYERDTFVFFRSFYMAAKKIKNKQTRSDYLMGILEYAFEGKEPELDGTASALFELSRLPLETSRKKFEGAKAGASKAKETRQQSEMSDTASAELEESIENDIEKDTESITEGRGQDTESITEGTRQDTESKTGGSEEDTESKARGTGQDTESITGGGEQEEGRIGERIKNKELRIKDKEKEKEKDPPYPPLEPRLQTALNDWLAYKSERRETYKPVGLKTLVEQIRRCGETHGTDAVTGLIAESISSGYKGIVWEKLTRNRASPTPAPAKPVRKHDPDNPFADWEEEFGLEDYKP